MALAAAILMIVLLAGVVIVATARRRDTAEAIGVLSRETRRHDVSEVRQPRRDESPAGRRHAVEREATLARRQQLPAVGDPLPTVPWAPPSDDVLGVTRRQFLNRGIVNMFGLGLAGFGGATLAFLWPSGAGGFGGKVVVPASVEDVLAYHRETKEPYYYAPGRLYIAPYPKSALPEAESVYDASVVAGMEEGVVALYQKCPHLGCRVPWCSTSQWFECPCHGSQYNRVGEKRGGPAPRGMDRFPMSFTRGRITVDTGVIVQGPPIGTNTTGQEAEGAHCVSRAEE